MQLRTDVLVACAAQEAVGGRLRARLVKGAREVFDIDHARPLFEHVVLHRAVHHIQQHWRGLHQLIYLLRVPGTRANSSAVDRNQLFYFTVRCLLLRPLLMRKSQER